MYTLFAACRYSESFFASPQALVPRTIAESITARYFARSRWSADGSRALAMIRPRYKTLGIPVFCTRMYDDRELQARDDAD